MSGLQETNDELTIVAKIYSELLEAFVEKMENRYVVGFSGAISIMLLTIEDLIDKKLDTLENKKGSEHDLKVLEHEVKEIRKTLERILDRIGGDKNVTSS